VQIDNRRMPCFDMHRFMTPALTPAATLVAALALSACAVPPAAGLPPPSLAPARLEVHTTAQGVVARLALTQTVAFVGGAPTPEADVDIVVHPGQRFQTMLGIGGAITDASAEVFTRLPADAQARLLRAYFDPDAGIGYTLLRTTIHSSDFSSASYTYVAEGDASLASFDIAPDRRHRIPMIRAAVQAAGGKLTTYVSPWSAPGWMKDSGRMVQGGSLRPEFAATWARYMTMFVHAYEHEGIPIWGLTVQNEPLARQVWESMIFSAEQERDFVRDHLGPTLARAGLGDRKLIVWDHNRDLIKHRADVILNDPEAAKYVWGVGFHWYETWDGSPPMHASVAATKQGWPGIEVLLTEATVEHFDPARLQSWPNAERYGRQIIGDFNAGAVGWTDWNILLDERGGPNHVGNFCFAPVHADSATGALTFTPTFAYLGHFSKFIRPGARRISAVSSRTSLHTTAFVNPDDRLAIVVLNDGDRPLRYTVRIGSNTVALTIPARAIQTLRG
jgi:glucosylceramidase